jgi:inner membrane protein
MLCYSDYRMDNLTHTLYGIALAKAGLDRTSRYAMPAILIGSNLPDIDLATIMGGQINYLRYHRGVTHSFLGIAIESLVLALFFMGFEKPGTHRKRLKLFLWLFLSSLLGTGSHLFLDYTNSYGIRPFLPFQSEWYSLDTVFIIDPWILFFLLIGLGITYLFRLINQEIGARPTSLRSGAILSLILISGYWVTKELSHRSALRELGRQPYADGEPLSIGAFPQFVNPFAWHGVIETPRAFHLRIIGWDPFQSLQTDKRIRSFYKPGQTEILQAVSQGDGAKIFLNFARYPFFQILQVPNGFEVEARDLRFEFASRIRKGFRYQAELDSHLKILSENFRF